MDAGKRAHFEEMLLEERARISGILSGIAETTVADPVPPPGDEPDPGPAGGSRDDDAAIGARETAALTEVDGALRLMYEEPDRYGVCTVCGEQIAANRLEIVPATRFCERHAPA